MRDKRYPFITSDLLIALPVFSVNGVSNFNKQWLANMAFYQLDKEGSTQEEYAKILDEMDWYVDNFINKANSYMFQPGLNSDDFTMTFAQQQPFIKATSDILTGWILPVTFNVSDQFNYCGLGC